jgi:hypothetical protein
LAAAVDTAALQPAATVEMERNVVAAAVAAAPQTAEPRGHQVPEVTDGS